MTYTEITNRVYFLTGTNSTNFPIADLTRAANNALERVVGLILKNDDKWQFDDYNQTDIPIATTQVNSGQQDYSMSASFLSVDRIEIQDSLGNWTELTQLDQQDLKRSRKVALAAYTPTNGLPREYDLIGNSIFLYPTPNYTNAASLKIYYTRPPVAFLTSDTTASPGFDSLFHDLVPLWVAYDYAVAKVKQNANGIFAAIQRKELELVDFYGGRDRDKRASLTISSNRNWLGNTSGVINSSGGDSNR